MTRIGKRIKKVIYNPRALPYEPIKIPTPTKEPLPEREPVKVSLG